MTDRQDVPFQLEEATIAELHDAIRAGKTTLVQVVQRYIDRARAYTLPIASPGTGTA
jgi:Asp-tRNA(Asn)/Glu-tRNA(Gln) amidotransferase A subunit family amidase